MNGTKVLLQHGWGWDAGCWGAWLPSAPPGVMLLVADRGYFGAPSSPAGQPRVLVAHSFGLHLLDSRWLERARLVVVLGGFQAFHPEEEGAGRRSRRLVGRMRQCLAQESVVLLADFHIQCFLPEIGQYSLPGSVDQSLLIADLEQLDTGVLDLYALRAVPRVLLLHGDQDRIVPVERAQALHRQLPNSRLQLIAGAGHALPFTRAPACWAHVREAWEEMGS